MTRDKRHEPAWLAGLINGALLADAGVPAEATTAHFESFGAPALTQVMAISALAGLQDRAQIQVGDPVCGFGTSMLTVARAAKVAGRECRSIGQDLVQPVIEVAAARAEHFGVEAEFHAADSLTDLRLDTGKFDIVTCEMPWGVSWRHAASRVNSLHAAGHFPLGLPRTVDSSWLFVQRALSMLKPDASGGGRACLLLPLQPLGSPSEEHFRRSLADQELLEAVIELPGGLSPRTSIPLALLVLNTSKASRMHGRVRLVDMRSFLVKTGTRAGALSEHGLRLLYSALTSNKEGPQNRTVRYEELDRTLVRLRPKTSRAPSHTWQAEIRHLSPKRLEARYGSFEVEVVAVEGKTLDLKPRSLFDEATISAAADDASSQPWTRLSAVLRSVADSEDTSGDADLWLPLDPDEPVVCTQPADRQVVALRVDETTVTCEFLRRWLNSTSASEQRRAVMKHLATGTHLYSPSVARKVLDELIVPLPTAEFSSAVLESLETIERVEAIVRQAKERVWTDDPTSVADEFSDLLDQSVERWSRSLPYPVASALWTFLGREGLSDRREQALQTLEAYAIFNATVLASVVRRDPEMYQDSWSAIERTLARQGLSVERATFGVWLVILEKLSAALRQLENDADPDDIDRLSRLFSGASRSFTAATTSIAAVNTLRQANQLRNDWTAHGGTVSDDTKSRQLDTLTELLESLQANIGRAWTRMPLVRAGRAAKRQGVFVQEVERVMGTSTPFPKDTMKVGEMMEENQLYLCYDGCPDPIKLAPFIVLRSSPESEQHAAYFYNRLDGRQVRMISYQTTREGEALLPADQILGSLGSAARDATR